MPERRSLSNAMELTPEKKAFIQGTPDAKPSALPARTTPPAQPRGGLETSVASEAAAEDRLATDDAPARRRAAKPRNRLEAAPVPNLDHFRVGVTVRIHPSIADALRRAHLEQKLNRQSPGTQQEIVEAALSDWLQKQGYLDA